MKRLVPILVVSIAVLLVPLAAAHGSSSPGAAAAAKTRSCGQLTVKIGSRGQYEGGASRIRGVRVSCHKARRVAAQCVRDKKPRGWRRSHRRVRIKGAIYPRFELRSGKRRVSYLAAGGGGC